MLTEQEQREGYQVKYGAVWNPIAPGHPMPDYMIEISCYMERHGIEKSKGYLGKLEHFKRGITALFAHKNCNSKFQWNPNALRMAKAYVENDDIAFVGHAGSTKSYCMAGFAVFDFLADPDNTGVILTSTTLVEAKLRIWGHVCRLWNDACAHPDIMGEKNMPGKLVPSDGIIRYQIYDPKIRALRRDDQRGLKLVAGSLAESKEGVEKMKGFHPPRLIVMMDELSDLSTQIPETVESNLKKTESCKVCAGLNAKDLLDAGGIYCEPERGWEETKTEELAEWKGKNGKIILRFDGKYSANKILGEQLRRGEITEQEYDAKKWAGLMDLEQWEKDVDNLGESSPNFLKQNRAIWPRAGSAEVIYTHDLLLKSGCKTKVIFLETPIVLAALDPAFSNGGDRCILIKCHFGKALVIPPFQSTEVPARIVNVLQYADHRNLNDGIDTSKDRNTQIAANAIAYLEDSSTGHVLKKNFALDITGAGSWLATYLAEKWGPGFYQIAFHGNPTDRSASINRTPANLSGKQENEPKVITCKDYYEDRVSEIWGIGEQFLRAGQLKNIPEIILSQMNKRPIDKGFRKIKIMSKKKMKTKSPDEADGFFMCLDLARERHSFLPAAKVKLDPKQEDDSDLLVRDKSGHILFDLRPTEKKEKKDVMSEIKKKFSFYRNSN